MTAGELHRSLTEMIPVQIWTANPDGQLDYVSEQTARVLGRPTEKILEEGWQAVVHPDDLPLAIERWTLAVSSGTPYETEFRLRLASGEYSWHLARAVPQRDAVGKVIRWFGTNTDIEGERQQRVQVQGLLAELEAQAEQLQEQNQRLALSEARFATTLSSIGDGVIATDAKGHVTYLNPVAQRLTGWDESECVGLHLDEMFCIRNEETGKVVESPVAKVLREGTIVGMANHTILVRRNGSELSIEDSAAPIRAADGTLNGIVLVFRDASGARASERERASLLVASQKAEEETKAALANAERLNRDLSEAEGVLRSLVDHLPELAWSAQPDGYIDFYNQRWFEYTGTTATDMLGWGWTQVHDPTMLEGVIERWTHSIETGERFEMEFPLRGADGMFRWFLTRVAPLRDGSGKVVRWFGTNTDIHKQRQEGQKAVEANLAKDEFLATASHELRNPLSAILGWARLLRDGDVDPKMLAKGLETIERNANAQVQLIEDILDGSRIMTGNLRLEVSPLDLVQVVQAALDTLRTAADAKKIQLVTNLDPEATRVVGDSERLQQIVWNLMSNAVKFTPEGGRVEVRLERTAAHIELSIRDSGEGIDPAFLPHVFDRFRQADATSTRRHGGLGLGLALVRHLVEAHGGTVHAESQGIGQGSRFLVRLPVRALYVDEETLDAEMAKSSSKSSAILDGVDVLVVDDELDGRDLVATVLCMQGASVTVAGGAEEALALFQKNPVGVIVSDVGMPGMDGYQLIRRIHQLSQESGLEVRAIALTAYVREKDRRLAFDAGFKTHLAKPVDPAELVRAVAELSV